jgi:hypothetical protein
MRLSMRIGFTIAAGCPAEAVNWSKVIKDANIRVD